MSACTPNPSRPWIMACALAALSVPLNALADTQQRDLAEGEQLYISQCKLCHGSVAPVETGLSTPLQWRFVRVAIQQGGGDTRTDASLELVAATQGAPASASRTPQANTEPSRRERLAFAPPFGPSLRGVYGRAAGSVEGFQYSYTFLKTLKGMEWNDAALDVWITSPQAWVPGVYMFYKQPDPEVRRKIILYLKANSSQ